MSTYEMGITRLVDSSLHFFLREMMSKHVSGETVRRVSESIYVLSNRPIVPTKPIVVYVDGVEIDKEDYDVYVESGEIRFKEPVDGIVTADYRYSILSVLDSYADDLVNPPLVAIENRGDSSVAGEIGSTSSFVNYEYHLHLYGEHEGQRDDLIDTFKSVVKMDCPIVNYNKGFPIDHEGKVKNYEKDVIGHISFGLPRIRRNPLNSHRLLERGRALIYLNGQIFK